ncbi:MAG: Phytoene dehydrogenase [Ilumatobacteraceae bacterium]|nr:Phytoene dehydrogenase [Ilumatobacteraceae bacterium]
MGAARHPSGEVGSSGGAAGATVGSAGAFGGADAARAVDAVVVGAGPNGLTAAVRLALAGRSVAVFEAGETIGGGCRTAELTLPGFRHDRCATIHTLGAGSPIFGPLDLEEHGVRYVHPRIALAHPLENGRAALLHRALDETVDGLGVDGAAWQRLVGCAVRRWDDLLPSLLKPLLSVPRHPLALAAFGTRALLPASVAAGRFGTDEGAALFAGCSAHSFLPLNRPLSASFGLLLAASGHAVGWPVVEGGSQALVDALAARLLELGGTITTGRRITSLGELPPHRVALFDTDPVQVASICASALPERYRARLRRYRFGPAAFKIDYALDGPMPWRNPAVASAGTVHIGGTFAEIRDAEGDVAAGRMPTRPFVLAVQATACDPTRAPAGKHTLWTYAHVPNGSVIDATGAIEAQLERFAPGFRDLVLARHVTAPSQLAAYNLNFVGGDINGGSFAGTQLVFRPTVALRSYRTPNECILICSASTPPGGGVHGACGANAADAALAGPLR